MIKITGVHKSYVTGNNSLHVLKGVDMTVEKGEMVSIMGSSGSGKSTLLNVIGLLDSYEAGEYYLDSKLMVNLSEKRAAILRNRMIGFVFQSFNLIAFKNAMENVALPLYYQKISRKRRNMIAMDYLDKFGLKEWWHHTPNELSGGQKQRVAMARAMITNPSVLLADEPTGALDSQTTLEVMDIFKEINKKEGMTIIIVTHEKDISEQSDRIIHLKDGIIEKEHNLKKERVYV